MHSLYDLLLQITGIVLCVAYRQKADLQVRTTLKRSLTENYTINQARDPVTLIWDLVMSRMECCGVNDYTDFQNAAKFQSEVLAEGLGRKIPDSCCAKNVTNLSVSDENLSDWNGNTQILESDQCISLPSRSNSYMYQVRMDIIGQEVSKPFTSGLLHQVHRDGIREPECPVWKSDWSRARSVRGHTLRLLYLQGETRPIRLAFSARTSTR